MNGYKVELILDNQSDLEVEIDFEHQPYEATTYWHPGANEDVIIYEVNIIEGKILDLINGFYTIEKLEKMVLANKEKWLIK